MAAKKLKRRKDKVILIRVTKEQKQLLAETAKDTGLSLSSWLLSVALRVAHAAQKKGA
jgi:uncharacterized protein (DUF1778 family)